MKKLLFLLLTFVIILSLASCDYFVKAPEKTTAQQEHEHTWEYVQREMGHIKQYTCGCESPDIMDKHCDNDGDCTCDVCGYLLISLDIEIEWEYTDTHHWYSPEAGSCIGIVYGYGEHVNADADLFCDICGYDMSELPTPTNYFLRNHSGLEWMNKITADDIAEIKIISEAVGVAPGALKNIESSVDKAVIARLFEEYYWVDTWPISKEEAQVDGGSLVTVKFILNDGTVKEIYINNGNYLDTDGNYFELNDTPKFKYGESFTSYCGFITVTGWDKCEVWCDTPIMVPYFVCDIPLEELKFYATDYNVGLGVSEYEYFIETDFGRLGFIRNDVFFIVGSGGQYYQLVGKNLDELIAEYKDKYSVTMNDEEWLYEDLYPRYAAGETVSVKIGIAYDLGFLLFVNGERVMPELDDNYDYWEFIFTMPDCDVVIDFKTYDGFLPNYNYSVLIEAFWEKIPEADYVNVVNYYGEFDSGAIAAMMSCSEYDYTEAEWDEVIDGVTIHYSNGNRILVLYEGEFYNLTVAYENGYITRDDLIAIRDLHTVFYKSGLEFDRY